MAKNTNSQFGWILSQYNWIPTNVVGIWVGRIQANVAEIWPLVLDSGQIRQNLGWPDFGECG
jgi:hypothetical protein